MDTLLIKFPTRNRPQRFTNLFDRYQNMLSGQYNVKFFITMDEDDKKMNTDDIKKFLDKYDNTNYYYGENHTKIEAVNADMDKVGNWDILLLASDDMVPVKRNYDYHIFKYMKQYFPNYDGALHFNDGNQPELFTLSIMGKKLYDTFGYIYHPDYVSLWCDNEFQDVTKKMKKYQYINKIIIKHMWEKNYDDLLKKTESFFRRDKKTYLLRKKKNFPKESVLTNIPSRLKITNRLNKKYNKEKSKVKKRIPRPINSLNKPSAKSK